MTSSEYPEYVMWCHYMLLYIPDTQIYNKLWKRSLMKVATRRMQHISVKQAQKTRMMDGEKALDNTWNTYSQLWRGWSVFAWTYYCSRLETWNLLLSPRGYHGTSPAVFSALRRTDDERNNTNWKTDQILYSISGVGTTRGAIKNGHIKESHSCCSLKKQQHHRVSGGSASLKRCPSPNRETPSGPELLRSRAAGSRSPTAATRELSWSLNAKAAKLRRTALWDMRGRRVHHAHHGAYTSWGRKKRRC